MSRRRIATAVATSLVAAGIVRLGLGLASASPACPVWTDPTADAAPGGLAALAGTPAASAGLDLVRLEVISDEAQLAVVVGVSKLDAKAGDTAPGGDAFSVQFKIAGKYAVFNTVRDQTPVKQTLYPPLVAAGARPADVTVGGVAIPATVTYDVASNQVRIVTKASDVATAISAAVVGSELDTFIAFSYGAAGGVGYPTYDTATAPGTLKAVGGCESTTSIPVASGTGNPTGSPSPTPAATPSASRSTSPTSAVSSSATPSATASESPSPTPTPPPASTVRNAGAASSQYGDLATVSAKLTNRSGAALAGKKVLFKLAGKSASATTNSAGVATAKLAVTATASSQTLTESFAGDARAAASTVSVRYAITTETTKIMIAVTKSGTARSVTATLRDNDNHAVGAQKLTVYLDGAKKTTLSTDSKGTVVYKAARAGQTVKFAFAVVTGKYAASSAQQKLS